MAIREIVTVPHSVLRGQARNVKKNGKDLQVLIDDMIETMRLAPGVGLAAPQVNVSLRVIVVEYGEEDEEGNTVIPTRLYSVINPEISRRSDQLEIGIEGCLSIPGFVGDVKRSEAVTVKGYNRHGQPMRIKANGWLARIFQHEIDHINGVLYTDIAERVWQLEEETPQVL
ncbi:MAG: peptide deformylase [Chloroflexota bacterium]|nr:peptide deformylase [Chloroflexota bacterium]